MQGQSPLNLAPLLAWLSLQHKIKLLYLYLKQHIRVTTSTAPFAHLQVHICETSSSDIMMPEQSSLYVHHPVHFYLLSPIDSKSGYSFQYPYSDAFFVHQLLRSFLLLLDLRWLKEQILIQ